MAKIRRFEMSAEQVKTIMRKFRGALESRDVEKIMSFFTDDAEWHAPEGAFKGKEQIRSYVLWSKQTTPDLKITEVGVKIVTEGDVGVYEHMLSGTIDGMKWDVLGLCVYEFVGNKVKSIRSVYDRLSMAKQASKGPVAKTAVSGILKRMEKGLH
jgi:ketosteroid isomerase-like protein